MPKEMIYLACPYSHPDSRVRHARFVLANAMAAELMRCGLHVFSPISHSHPIADYGLPGGWDYWAEYDRWFLERCDRMYVLKAPGWKKSVGLQAEVETFTGMGKPIHYLECPDVNWSYGSVKKMLAAAKKGGELV